MKDKCFDSVIALDLIEHLYDIDNFLFEVNRILKNKGVFILSAPNALSWRNRLKFIFCKNFIFNEYKIVGHLIFFDFSSLKNKLEELKFKDIKIMPMGNVKIRSFCGEFLVICYKI